MPDSRRPRVTSQQATQADLGSSQPSSHRASLLRPSLQNVGPEIYVYAMLPAAQSLTQGKVTSPLQGAPCICKTPDGLSVPLSSSRPLHLERTQWCGCGKEAKTATAPSLPPKHPFPRKCGLFPPKHPFTRKCGLFEGLRAGQKGKNGERRQHQRWVEDSVGSREATGSELAEQRSRPSAIC